MSAIESAEKTRKELVEQEQEERIRDMNYSLVKRAFARKIRKQIMDRMKGKRRSIWGKDSQVKSRLGRTVETRDFTNQVTSKKIKKTLLEEDQNVRTPPTDGRKYVFITN